MKDGVQVEEEDDEEGEGEEQHHDDDEEEEMLARRPFVEVDVSHQPDNDESQHLREKKRRKAKNERWEAFFCECGEEERVYA